MQPHLKKYVRRTHVAATSKKPYENKSELPNRLRMWIIVMIGLISVVIIFYLIFAISLAISKNDSFFNDQSSLDNDQNAYIHPNHLADARIFQRHGGEGDGFERNDRKSGKNSFDTRKGEGGSLKKPKPKSNSNTNNHGWKKNDKSDDHKNSEWTKN